ncbi:MAG: haloalkane dehalogenase [Nitriliruptorales bacterium]|nr:haloalkane dehalogenase [Nitriliruptorales bacterium]
MRTPDERFEDLPGWDHDPLYTDWEGLRLARVEAGPASGETVVLLHGEPTWGYLYRKVIPPLVDAGLRVVAPDLPGFGRSDKPTDRDWYQYDRLYDALDAQLSAASPDDPVTLVVHDWGGLLGLVWATEHPERVARLVICNTALYVPGREPSEAWLQFHDFVERADELPIGYLVDGAVAGDLDEEVRAAYEAPFHEPAAHAGAIALPLRVPLSDEDPGAQRQWAANQALTSWEVPTLIIWGADDPILPVKVGQRWAETIPGCVGLETLTPAAHFLQEDQGERMGELISRFVTSEST